MPKETVFKSSEKIKPIFAGGKFTAPKFIPNLSEWLVTHGKRVHRWIGAMNNLTTLYTVPKGKILFILSLSLSVSTSLAAPTNEYVYIFIQKIEALGLYTGGGSITWNPVVPIRLNSGENIQVNSDWVDVYGMGSFIGYIVDSNDIPVL